MYVTLILSFFRWIALLYYQRWVNEVHEIGLTVGRSQRTQEKERRKEKKGTKQTMQLNKSRG